MSRRSRDVRRWACPAAAIHARLIAALDGDVQPGALIALSDETLRAVGLSRAKVVSLRELPAMVRDGTVVLSAQRLARKSGEEILTFLSTVRGIGHWTAEMFLLFQLRRLDVWPAGDFGIHRGYGLAWEVPTPTARELGRRVIRIVPAARWRPGIAGGPLSSAERQARAR